MKEYSIIKKLIDWAEKYDSQLTEGEQWVDGNFASWLSNEVKPVITINDVHDDVNGDISMLIIFMYKYASFYSRKIFKHSLIYSIEDFGVLATLLPDKQLIKADVIRQCISEKSSGNEVLKRLLRQKLIKETNNPADKRSKLLQITFDGLNEMNSLWGKMDKMGALITGNLTEHEKIILLDMLSKLHQFHNPLFEANNEMFLNQKLGVGK